MKCPYCGKELNEGSKICDGCGSQINSQPANDTYTPIEVKRNNNFTGIAIAVLFVVIAGLLLWLFVFSGNGGNDNTNSNSNENSNNTITEVKSYLTVTNLRFALDEARRTINEGRLYLFYETDKLLLIPVGEDTYGCVGKDNFKSSDLKYAYIGVTYSGEGYDYYVIALDKNGYGINMVSANNLTMDSIEKNALEYELLTNIYNSRADINHIYEDTDENFLSVFKVNDKIKTVFITAEVQCEYKNR